MICFNCGMKLNTSEDRTCLLCGVKFAIRCSVCKYPNSSVSRYCFNCGSKILTPDSSSSSIQNFDTLSESRKNVAIIFADISGFSALSEKLDPEEVREIINDCFDYITRPVYELEGTIDKYIGDCVMILFGAKYPHGDDAKRAVICALKMMSLIREFSENMLSSRNLSLDMSVGVNFGLVVTGSVGNYFDRDYTVMGNIVNMAQRLQTGAEQGTVLVSESVYMETKDAVRYSEMTRIRAKNMKNPIKCYKALGMLAENFSDCELPFIGRENEIAALNTIYNQALNTGIQSITVIGEAGIGKTRLLREFISKLGNDIKKITVECNAVLQARAYSPIANMLVSVMNINPGDNIDMKRHRLISFAGYVLDGCSDEDIRRNYDFLGLLLGLDREGEFQNILDSMSFYNIQKEILKQLVLFFRSICKKHRYIFSIDDLHFADENSLQILSALIPLLSDVNTIFIFTSRYEIDSIKIDENERNHVIKPGALDKAGIRELTGRLFNCSGVDDFLDNMVNRFTGGNPLYIREFVSSIKRSGKYFISNDTAYLDSKEAALLPGNIQSLVLSNIAALDERTRDILYTVSVIGGKLNLSLINGLFEYNPFVDEALKLLVRLDIIELTSVFTVSGNVEKVFAFRHETEREVIYESILNKRKKELHKKIAGFIEESHVKDIENYYDILCVHYHNAGIDKKAGEYYYRIAQKYKNDFYFSESIRYFDKFLEAAERINDADNNQKISYAYRDIGYIYYVMADYERSVEYLNKALQTAIFSDDANLVKIIIAEVYKDKGMYKDSLQLLDEMEPVIKSNSAVYGKLLQMKSGILRITGDPGALSYSKKSERLLLQVKDYQNLSETMKQSGMIYFTKGDIDNALFYMNKSYKYAEKVNNLEAMAKISGDLGIIYHSTGMVSKAMEFFYRSMDISKKISYLRGYVATSINLGILYMDKGFFNKAESLFRESLNISAEISSRLYECISFTNMGDVMYENGSFNEASDYYKKSLEIAGEMNLPVEEGVGCIGLARLYIKTGSYDEASLMLGKAYDIFTGANEISYLGDYHICRGRLELIKGDAKAACENSEKAMAVSDECRSGKKKIKALRLKGYALLLMNTDNAGKALQIDDGNADKALRLFDEAIDLSRRIESDYEAAKSYFGKYKVYTILNDIREADANLAHAREFISKVDICRWTDIIKHI